MDLVIKKQEIAYIIYSLCNFKAVLALGLRLAERKEELNGGGKLEGGEKRERISLTRSYLRVHYLKAVVTSGSQWPVVSSMRSFPA